MIELHEIPVGVTKQEKYSLLYQQAQALLQNEQDSLANMANLCALLKYGMSFFWVGFYLVKDKELVLGPFQGPVACTRIGYGKGVCGKAWEQNQTILVDDVNDFDGHIACSSFSKSEIVIPLHNLQKQCIGVLDIDSEQLKHFDETDRLALEQMIKLLKL